MSIVFFHEFYKNICASAQEHSQKCLKLIEPRDLNDLKELRMCIKKIKLLKKDEKTKQIIILSYKGSSNLSEKILNWDNSTKVNPK